MRKEIINMLIRTINGQLFTMNDLLSFHFFFFKSFVNLNKKKITKNDYDCDDNNN